MKKLNNNNQTEEPMSPEYDFSGKQGVRGKYHQANQQGHTVRIHETDGTVTVQYFALEDGAILLEPDVREYFPDSESVNKALRSLIALIPEQRSKKVSFSGKSKSKADRR
jgi:hypothetical protein